MFHSSQLSSDAYTRAINADRLVVVGSGKAAIEVLSQLEPRETIIWAHRGHTAFHDRRVI